MRSGYSAEVTGTTGTNEAPQAPVLQSKDVVGTTATLVFVLPTLALNGQPLAAGAFTELLVYADKQTFLGRLESLVNLEPHTKVPAAVGGAPITVVLTGLEANTEYRFLACVN